MGILRDLAAATVALLLFLGVNYLAALAAEAGYDDAFHVVAFSLLFAKVLLQSVMIWILVRVAFPQTLGRALDDVFDQGWGAMLSAEKTRWVIVSFLVLFFSLSLMSQ